MGNDNKKPEQVKPSENESNVDNTPDILTWNGAKSYGDVSDPLVELFFKSCRNIKATDYNAFNKNNSPDLSEGKSIEDYFDAAWKAEPLLTLKFVFHLRDVRKGKGEKKLFRALIRHMLASDLKHLVKINLSNIPFYGSWKDVLLCFCGTPLEKDALVLIADMLLHDSTADSPTLCAKYAPSEKSRIDQNHHVVGKLCRLMAITPAVYRKKYLTPLRAKLNIVERDMCAKNWSDIDYEKVPSLAGKKYSASFKKRDNERYVKYLESVVKGEKKMNTSVLMPYQIVSTYIHSNSQDNVVEAQWLSFVMDRYSKWNKSVNVLPIIDVSGSMTAPVAGDVRALDVAVSTGLLFASLNENPLYKDKFVTFSATPKFVDLSTETSLFDKVKKTQTSEWGMNTNFQAVFDLLLQNDTDPDIILVLSDMQFDQSNNNSETNWETIERKYVEKNRKRPVIIFWNLNGRSADYPVPHQNVEKCMLVSGFNDSFFYSIIDLKMPSPRQIVDKILNDARYDQIVLDEGSN